MITDNIWDQVRQHDWKWTPRTQTISVELIHTTRGGSADNFSEYAGGMNWFISPNNRRQDAPGQRDYAGIASRLVGAGGKMCVVMPDEMVPTFSAGHIDPIGVSWELAQPRIDSPFDPADLDRLVLEVGANCRQHSVPVRMIPFLSGDNHEAPGIAFHDASANGIKWGKSDPGPLFDRAGFVALVAIAAGQAAPGFETGANDMIRQNGISLFFEGRTLPVGEYVIDCDLDFKLPPEATGVVLELFLAATPAPGTLVLKDASGAYAGQVGGQHERYRQIAAYLGPLPERGGSRGVRFSVTDAPVRTERIGIVARLV